MIIYTKKDAAIIIPCGLGPSVCPDVSHELQTKTVDSSTVLQQVRPDSEYYGLSSVTVEPYTLDSKTVNSSTAQQVITSDVNGLSSVTVEPYVLDSKTVNSSTAQQVITSSVDGLSSVTVEPYTLDSKTVNSSTAQQVITSDKDGLSSVTVEPYVLDSKTVNSSTAQQVITSSEDGLSSVIVEPYTLDSKMVDPSTSEQTVTSSVDGLSSVTVNAVTSSIDPDIQAGNIKRGVEILGVTGTFDGGSLQSKEVNSSTNSQSVTPDSGYYGLSGVTVKPYTLESKAQTITLNGTYSFTPTSANGLSSVDISVNVADIPAVVQSKSVTYTENGEYTVTPDQGYDGLSSVDISVNIPPEPVVLQSKTVKSSTESQSVTYDSGYDGLSSVTVEPYELDSKTVNSSTAQQVITSSVDGLTSVTVEPYELDSKTVNSSTAQQVVTSSKDGLSSVTVEPYVLDSKTVDPSTSQITVNSSADGLSSVTVNAVTSSIDANISSSNIKRGVEILGVTGAFDGGSLGTKTVNSSTSTQTITPESSDYGLSSVTVNPYTLDSKTVNSSTAQQVITSSVDGLSSVTVNPYTVESDSSTLTANGTYTFTPTSADALSSVTVDVSVNTGGATNWIEEARLGNITDISGYSIAELAKKQYGAAGLFMYSNITSIPRIQDPEDSSITGINNIDNHSLRQTFFGCNSLQNVDISVGCIGMYGMYQCFSQSSVSDVSINVNELDGNGAYTFAECFSSSPYLRNLYINLGPGAQVVGQNAFYKMCYSVCTGSSENFNTTITIEGLQKVYSNAFNGAFFDMHTNNSGRITVNLPDNLVLNGSSGTDEAFHNICKNSHLTGKTTPSFLGKIDYINGNSNFTYAFANSDIETATLGFNTCKGDMNFNYTFNNCQNLREVTFDGTFNVSGSFNFSYTFEYCNSLTSMTCTSTAGTKPFRYSNTNNVASSARGISDITIDNVNSDIYLLWNPSVNAASVYGILSKAVGATLQEGDTRKIEFYMYSDGLKVTDFEDGRIQTAYNAAVADGWTINNLTILPYSNS